MSRRLVFSKRARQDFIDIQAFIARESGSATVGAEFVRKLRLKCRNLASLPGTHGTSRPELAPGLRSFAYGNYVIMFRYAAGKFEVINVLEGHRDMPAYFRRYDL